MRRALIMDYAGVLDEGPELLDLVRRARAVGVPTALVTDAHAVPDGFDALFDVLVLGPSIGVRKPDPEVYRRVATMLGRPVDECVVVDDSVRNVRGARQAGAVAVHHQRDSSTVTDVEILLDLPTQS
jgi:HAD superfamily hydrolase (TIGR01509 family)